MWPNYAVKFWSFKTIVFYISGWKNTRTLSKPRSRFSGKERRKYYCIGDARMAKNSDSYAHFFVSLMPSACMNGNF